MRKGATIKAVTLVEKYNTEWPDRFKEIKTFLGEELARSCIRIEHVGSTAVVGMTAKPVIDLVLVIRSKDFDKIKSLLVEHGYHHEGDKGIPGREAFKLKDEYDTRNLMKHHLYVCSENNNALRNHIAFREFLKNNKEYAGKLSRLKWELAEKFDNDREAYIDGKAALCEEITKLAQEQMAGNK